MGNIVLKGSKMGLLLSDAELLVVCIVKGGRGLGYPY